MNKPILALLYDRLCPLCSREIEHSRRRAAQGPGVLFVDVAALMSTQGQ